MLNLYARRITMAVNRENKIVPITLTKIHQSKLAAMCQRTGLTKTQVVQRLIEMHTIQELVGSKNSPPPVDDD
jgi:hypothetical protein